MPGWSLECPDRRRRRERQEKQETKAGIRSDQGQRKEGRYGCGLLPQVISMYLLSAETSGVSRLKGKKVLTGSIPFKRWQHFVAPPLRGIAEGGGVPLSSFPIHK